MVWPTAPTAGPGTSCERWAAFVAKIVELGTQLLQIWQGAEQPRLSSDWVKSIMRAAIDFDPGYSYGVPALDTLYAGIDACDFSDLYMRIGAGIFGLNNEALRAAYAVQAALEALSSAEWTVSAEYGQEESHGKHSELGLGI